MLHCGHDGAVVSGDPSTRNTRCWDCHLAELRSLGFDARADRLVERKRQQDEGRLGSIVDAILASYAGRVPVGASL